MSDDDKATAPADEGGIIADEKQKKGTKKSVSTSKPVEITFEKYVQLHQSGLNKYTRSYVGARFRGILKTKKGWDEALSQYMEGNK